MKLSDVLDEAAFTYGAGAHTMVSPGAFISAQVVQPITRQAVDPSQTHLNKKLAKKKAQKEIDVEDYNDLDVDELSIHYDFAHDGVSKQFDKFMNKLKGRLKTKEQDDES